MKLQKNIEIRLLVNHLFMSRIHAVKQTVNIGLAPMMLKIRYIIKS